jgi:hypothetical protein
MAFDDYYINHTRAEDQRRELIQFLAGQRLISRPVHPFWHRRALSTALARLGDLMIAGGIHLKDAAHLKSTAGEQQSSHAYSLKTNR